MITPLLILAIAVLCIALSLVIPSTTETWKSAHRWLLVAGLVLAGGVVVASLAGWVR